MHIRTLTRALGVVLTLAAIAVAVAPEASAHRNQPLRSTETFTLDIYDSYLSRACGVEVVATLEVTERRNVFLGADEAAPARELTTYDGDITWLARASGATYSDKLKSTLEIAYPQGIELWKPARAHRGRPHTATPNFRAAEQRKGRARARPFPLHRCAAWTTSAPRRSAWW